jgi:hypothetical protein
MKLILFLLSLLVGVAVPTQAQHQQPIAKWLFSEDSTGKDSIQVVFLPPFPIVTKIIPPMIYDKWWKEIMQCSGLTVPNSLTQNVEFFSVLGKYGFMIEGLDYSNGFFGGYTMAWKQQIYLAVDEVLDKKVVKHEMLHFLLYNYGNSENHPALYFKQKCKLSR